MNRSTLASGWADLRSQWQVNTRLRAGLWLVVGITWIYALLLVGDAVVAVRRASAAMVDEIDRLRPLTRSNPWPARVEEARQEVAALNGMQWSVGSEGQAGDLGLVEAALQDWVRGTAAKAGLRVRDLALARSASADDGASRQRSAMSAAASPAGQPVRLRMTVEWGRSELVAFLAEVGRQERVVVVERLLLRPTTPAASAEIDLRVWARGVALPPGTAGNAKGAVR